MILIDGRSGSGKTSLADRVARALGVAWRRRIEVAHLDQWYPGWTGLAKGSLIAERLLGAGSAPVVRQWDWELNRPGRSLRFDPTQPLIIEGSGALTLTSAGLVDVSIWVQTLKPDGRDDSAERKRRALGRDGDLFAPWWNTWAEQEDAHIAANKPATLADLRLST